MDAKWPDCEQGGCFTLPGYQDADGRQVAGLRTSEQGGCFTLPGYQDADGRQVAGLRTRGLFCPVGLS